MSENGMFAKASTVSTANIILASLDKDDDWCAERQNWIQKWHNSLQTSSSFTCSILMAVYVSGGSKESAHCSLAFDIDIEAIHP
ncbi:hypothetical protein TNCV_2632711 [Trichonephila clavipes]|nr:hypothetical protein TNCV_2632711 [Trichonephila clavipes]